jgi:hypothetical protein
MLQSPVFTRSISLFLGLIYQSRNGYSAVFKMKAWEPVDALLTVFSFQMVPFCCSWIDLTPKPEWLFQRQCLAMKVCEPVDAPVSCFQFSPIQVPRLSDVLIKAGMVIQRQCLRWRLRQWMLQLSVHCSIPKPKVVPGLMSKVEWLFKLIVLRWRFRVMLQFHVFSFHWSSLFSVVVPGLMYQSRNGYSNPFSYLEGCGPVDAPV